MYPTCYPLLLTRRQEHCIEYTRKLEEGGKFTLCVWPEHCLVTKLPENDLFTNAENPRTTWETPCPSTFLHLCAISSIV